MSTSAPPNSPSAPRESEAVGATDYDQLVGRRKAFLRRQREGKVVVWPSDRPLQQTRQGRLRYYLNVNYEDTCLPEWSIKIQEIPVRSGKHRHQGSVLIFALEGEGATVMDGRTEEWEAGDLVVLPQRAESVAHQHFNRTPSGAPARWTAFSHHVMYDYLGDETQQLDEAPGSPFREASAQGGTGDD